MWIRKDYEHFYIKTKFLSHSSKVLRDIIGQVTRPAIIKSNTCINKTSTTNNSYSDIFFYITIISILLIKPD